MDSLHTEKERLLSIAFDGLEKVYPRGLYDFLHTHDRALYDRIDEIEDALNKSFAGGGAVDEFKAMLRQYWDAHMRAIRAFQGKWPARSAAGGQTGPDCGARGARVKAIRNMLSMGYILALTMQPFYIIVL